ncbi:UNVERIFIED_CONTAM: hypothetical protein Sangu_1470700 [Sesamum angustifolium]|uniref:Late embryogenesis abundant protein LEA-2 subgroup domain-containing protein n=1 Tax=Sesamum angustifolium TaxID=2727405 RepID=A0AAW2NAS0_9LAMI
MSSGLPKPPLQKPPGYREANTPVPRPHLRKPVKLPPSFYQTKRRNACCRACCCCICILTVILTLAVVSAGGLFYLWFQPHLPEIHLTSINFTKFKVTTAPDGPVLDSECSIGVEIKNPNQKLKMVYDRTQISLTAADGNANLGEQTVPGFTQNKNNVTNLKFKMKAEKELLDSKSADELKNEFRSKSLLVDVELRTGIGLKGSGWGTGTARVDVLCQGVRLSQDRPDGEMPKCRFKILNLDTDASAVGLVDDSLIVICISLFDDLD